MRVRWVETRLQSFSTTGTFPGIQQPLKILELYLNLELTWVPVVKLVPAPAVVLMMIQIYWGGLDKMSLMSQTDIAASSSCALQQSEEVQGTPSIKISMLGGYVLLLWTHYKQSCVVFPTSLKKVRAASEWETAAIKRASGWMRERGSADERTRRVNKKIQTYILVSRRLKRNNLNTDRGLSPLQSFLFINLLH